MSGRFRVEKETIIRVPLSGLSSNEKRYPLRTAGQARQWHPSTLSWFPLKLFETLTDLTDLTDPAQADRLRVRRYGVIETTGGELTQIVLRPWPKLWSLRELVRVGPRWRPEGPTDRCRLYFNQPRGHEGFLALRYVAATPGTSYATFRAALSALDAIAAIKGSDALVCDAANHRLSERYLKRMGWQAHAPRWGHRNYIRRFYGEFPLAALKLAGLETIKI